MSFDESQIGAELFGRTVRLRLALWILRNPKDRFFQSEPPREVGAPTAVRQELERFTRVGLLDVERPDGENRIYYVRTDTDLWEIFRVVDAVLGEPSN